jgi:hypothetical protein
MNERIRALALQAEQYAQDDLTERRAVGAPLYAEGEYDNKIKQKFAELIVRECMSVADLPNNASGQWDHLLSSEVIGKHFGVES